MTKGSKPPMNKPGRKTTGSASLYRNNAKPKPKPKPSRKK